MEIMEIYIPRHVTSDVFDRSILLGRRIFNGVPYVGNRLRIYNRKKKLVRIVEKAVLDQLA